MRRWVWAACVVIFLVLPAGCRGPQGPNSPLPLAGPQPYGWERPQHELDEQSSWENRHHRDH